MPPRWARALAVLGVALAGGAATWAYAPRWLAIQDQLIACPAIVVLNGDPPARANEAARLYHAGVGSEIWLTSDPLSSDVRGDAGTRWNAAHLAMSGVPGSAIRLVPGVARGTRAELRTIAAEMTRRGLACTIAVTSPLHARRVKLTWQRRVGPSPMLVVRHAAEANYIGWRKVARELAGTLGVLVGLDLSAR
jgi:uncharacterized SAM-binding protein YcdF (DUF218 family)